ncbi:hypothetical protein Nepgr_004051 [Nepenthes gracilis]|uniref:Uncharacterized protein n=1 Tax=Nepenthes gracilis TaxID=150966 RepID=A0AAD3S0V3_NEPGR|nr:hypothetical protein Nepgr_004051 [Nepenthes gracilis]
MRASMQYNESKPTRQLQHRTRSTNIKCSYNKTRRSNAGQPIHHTDCNENTVSQPGKNSTAMPSTSAENFSCDQNLQLQHHNMSLKTSSRVDTFRVIHTAAKFISKKLHQFQKGKIRKATSKKSNRCEDTATQEKRPRNRGAPDDRFHIVGRNQHQQNKVQDKDHRI